MKVGLGLVGGTALLLGLLAASPFILFDLTDGFQAVLPGECYRAGEMAPEALVQVCRENGIRAVVDLRSEMDGLTDEAPGWSRQKIEAERAALTAAGIRHINVDARQVASRTMTDAFVKVLREPGTRPVLIHCDHGVGRTGFFVAVYLMEFAGYTPEEARRNVAQYFSYRPGGRKNFRPDAIKGRLILEYQKGGPGPATPVDL